LPHDVSLDQLRAIRKDGIKFGIAKRHGCWADAPAESLGGSREQPRHSCWVLARSLRGLLVQLLPDQASCLKSSSC
jgi:hypothetical protein